MTMSRRGRLPRVSVVLPVHNGEATLPTALASLAAQTMRDFEVVIVDDGSRDATPRIARAWQWRDDRFRVVRTAHGGIVSALQRGLAEVRGAYMARMDADDVSHPGRLSAQLELLERRADLAGCGTGVRYVPESDVTPRSAEYAAWVNSMTNWGTVAANIFVECPLAHPTFMFRTRTLTSAGGYRDRGWPEDYDLLLRLWRQGLRFVALPRILLDWGNREGRLSRTHPAYSLDAFRACRVHHVRRSLLEGRIGVVVWGAGPTGKRLAREFQRQEVAVKGFIEVDPRKIGQLIHGAPVRDAGAAREFGDVLHVGAVARGKGRAAVAAEAGKAGLVYGANFVSMA
ncbi:MAG: glycosyltransferase [Gemmatimonadetes bacterium]|nr:glycosyltransferase [Gemmatimonadota bacterium]